MLLNCGAGEDSRVPWTARRSNQSILKEINHDYSLKGLMLKLKLQHFGHLMQRANSLEKTLMLGKIKGKRRRGWQKMRWLRSPTQWTSVWANSRRWWRTGKPGMLQSKGWQRVGHKWMTEQQPDCLPQWLYQFIFPPIVQEGSLFSTHSPAFIVCRFFWWWPFWPLWGDFVVLIAN